MECDRERAQTGVLSLLQVLYPDRPGVVPLLRRGCGVLPQHLDTEYDISDALDAPALASTWLYDSVSRSSDLSRLRLSFPQRRGGFKG